MDKPPRRRSMLFLVVLSLLGLGYILGMALLHWSAGSYRVDGSIGVVFGLYICSRPAANFLDMLLFWRTTRPEGWSWQWMSLWLALNLTTMLVGWFVIVTGATRFTLPVHPL